MIAVASKLNDLRERAVVLCNEIENDADSNGNLSLHKISLSEFIASEFMQAVAAVEGELVPAPHLGGWADLIEINRFAALIAFRGSLKSTLLKGVIANALREHRRGAFDAIFYSAKMDLARWHLRRLKLYIEPLAAQWGWRDATAGEALLRYERPGAMFTCEPEGLDAASRGRRADLLVIDDPADPRKLASFADLDRVLESLQRRVLPLLKDNQARVVFAGTPIVAGDIVSWIEKNPEFVTARLPAILSDGRPAWLEKYDKTELDRIRKLIGDKSFRAEYLLEAVAPLDSYIDSALLKRAIARVGVGA